MFKQITDAVSNNGANLNKADTVKYLIYTVIVVLIFGLVAYIRNKIQLNQANCDALSKIYTGFPKLSSFNQNDAAYGYLLRDYYIKTAYNCCCGGQFKNDYVNVCALKTCIAQGARVLDFEIYSLNDKPVIATSVVTNNFHTKSMYNQVDFKEALDIVNNYAFSNGSCPNPNDPLLLHFRIQSNNDKIYKEMADMIYNTIGSRILDKVYSYQYSGYNLGAVPLKEFMGKIIISVDRSNPLFETTPLNEYVNMSSNSMFFRASRSYDIKFAPDSNELIEYNKKYMTISMPDVSVYDTNVDASLHMKYGVQCVGMCFQNFDSNMEYYDMFFDKTGHAFVLKPETLRYVPVTIPSPTKQSPENSYTTRTTATDYYSISV